MAPAGPAELDLVLPVEPPSVPAARHAVEDVARAAGACPGTVEALRLAVSEACTNVVLHAYRETDDNRYLMTLTGICRFELKSDQDCAGGYRKGACDFSAFAEDMAVHDEQDFPRERLVDALKDYLTQNDLKADWKSILTAPAEALVNALAMMCPFGGAEKQALLEAPSFDDRVSTLVALLEMSVQGGPVTLN